MQKTFQEHSLAMAKMVQDEFELRARRVNRGVKSAGFVVLWMTTMPSILVETGFLTHPEEEKYLASEQGQDHLASAIFRAFRHYKNNIEENSNFQRIAVKEEQNTELPSGVNQEDNIYFKVQVIVSKKKLDTEDRFFRGYDNIEEFKAGNWHKYAVGYSTSYEEIEAFCEKVREDFPDAFVIAVRDGKLLNLNEALKAKR
jgi:N-acetylmuramoyl-L-alanine amidase